MTFEGFDRSAVALLRKLPGWDAAAYAAEKSHLRQGVFEPGWALIESVAEALDADLTVVRRASVSPLHRDLRFAAKGAARYKDHLLLTAWHGRDKKFSPTLWIRLDADPPPPRAELLRMNSFQIRFMESLPASVGKPSFARWCATRLRRLLPIHEWLVAELSSRAGKGRKT